MPSQDKILIVDDSPLNIQVVAGILGKRGYDISYATSGSHALVLVADAQFDLILLDLMMPGMDGYEVCKRLRDMDAYKNVPIIFLTAKHDEESIVKGFEVGGQDYLTKPFNSSELLARVETQIKAKKYKDIQQEIIKDQGEYQAKLEHEVKEQTRNINRLSMHLEKVREEEKRHIAAEIHDELGVTLTALNMELSVFEKKLKGVDEVLGHKVQNMRELVTEASQTARRIISDLRPSILDTMGLIAAIEWQGEEFSRRYKIRCNIKSNVDAVELSEANKIALFRIFQECLTNIAKHANAKNVNVDLVYINDILRLKIKDDGVGFEPNEYYVNSHGINGIRERLKYIGGHCKIDSKPGEGVTVLIDMPLANQE